MRLNLLLTTVAAVAIAAATLVQAQTPAPPPAQTQGQTPVQQTGPIEVEIDQGVLRPFQIAIVPFSGSNGSQITDVIGGDLRRSGFFEPINPASFIETGLTLANAPDFAKWTNIGAQAVLYGSVTPDFTSPRSAFS